MPDTSATMEDFQGLSYYEKHAQKKKTGRKTCRELKNIMTCSWCLAHAIIAPFTRLLIQGPLRVTEELHATYRLSYSPPQPQQGC